MKHCLSIEEFDVFRVSSPVSISVGRMKRLMDVADEVHDEREGLPFLAFLRSSVIWFRSSKDGQEVRDFNRHTVLFAGGIDIGRCGFKGSILYRYIDEMPIAGSLGRIWEKFAAGRAHRRVIPLKIANLIGADRDIGESNRPQ